MAQPPLVDMRMDNAKSIYVIDGDSISLSMRIKDIDTPEKNQHCQKYTNKTIDCGEVAKAYLKSLLDNIAGELRIRPITIGYYKRILVEVYKGEVNIGKRMVERGMAYAYGEKYKAQELFAQKHKHGFWNYAFPPERPRDWRKKHKRVIK